MPGYGPHNTPLKRIEIKNIRDAVLELFNFEKGLGYTLLNLFLRPGEVVNKYLFEDRSKMVKPFGFVVLAATIATFLTVNFADLSQANGLNNAQLEQMGINNLSEDFFDFYNRTFGQLYNFMKLTAVPILAFCAYAIYSEAKYNYAENLVASAYISAATIVFYILSFPLFYYDYFVGTYLYMLFFLVYVIFAYKQLFEVNWKTALLKGILMQFMYFIMFGVVMALFGVGIGMYWAIYLK